MTCYGEFRAYCYQSHLSSSLSVDRSLLTRQNFRRTYFSCEKFVTFFHPYLLFNCTSNHRSNMDPHRRGAHLQQQSPIDRIMREIMLKLMEEMRLMQIRVSAPVNSTLLSSPPTPSRFEKASSFEEAASNSTSFRSRPFQPRKKKSRFM